MCEIGTVDIAVANTYGQRWQGFEPYSYPLIKRRFRSSGEVNAKTLC
ncbi:hypothetical protein OH492_19080 [Vibrio chagasii]|nr:hypothetical protein [Vibrio chagasii]